MQENTIFLRQTEILFAFTKKYGKMKVLPEKLTVRTI